MSKLWNKVFNPAPGAPLFCRV